MLSARCVDAILLHRSPLGVRFASTVRWIAGTCAPWTSPSVRDTGHARDLERADAQARSGVVKRRARGTLGFVAVETEFELR